MRRSRVGARLFRGQRDRKSSASARDNMLTILFDGIAYGMLLFVLACGLSVTLGLMNFINLAHGAFAVVTLAKAKLG